MGREFYNNGDPVGLVATGCDGCSPSMVNGVLCHEAGCSERWRDYPTRCFFCGQAFMAQGPHDQTCPDCWPDE